MTSFWRNNDVIIVSCVCWGVIHVYLPLALAVTHDRDNWHDFMKKPTKNTQAYDEIWIDFSKAFLDSLARFCGNVF